ncbi:MAG: hypothetical protein JRJ04_10055 [Deltaproteobacteria bacterium]|nr:hypothetical protein [Deltaproteobacteria bacterium]
MLSSKSTLRCSSRAMAAAVAIGSLRICYHLENRRLLAIITLPRLYRSAIRVNSTSI